MSTEQAPVVIEPVAPETPVPAPVESTNGAPAESSAPSVASETPLTKLTAQLCEVIKTADYNEMWGVELSDDSSHAPTQVILAKFLRANNDDVAAAAKQLASALEWRKKMQPGQLVSEVFDKKKFGDLGYVTTHKDEAGKETVITWNIYGAVKDNKATFGNVEEFIRWRAALMELGVQKLRLNGITEPPSEKATDDHQMIQVHDYQSVSFFRMDPAVKAASKETIETFSMAYPELLSHKYFVNVPLIMGWMFGIMKHFLSAATLRKFHPMTSGTTLATELKSISASLPSEYGGQGPSVQEEGETVKLVDLAPNEEEQKPEDGAHAGEKAAEESNESEEMKTEATAPAHAGTEIMPAADIETNGAAEADRRDITA